jgi:hypothetical protein
MAECSTAASRAPKSTAASDLTPEQRAQGQEQALALKNAAWNVSGYQADFDFPTNTGQLYEQDSPRGHHRPAKPAVATEPGKSQLYRHPRQLTI